MGAGASLRPPDQHPGLSLFSNRPPAQWAGGLVVSARHIAQLNEGDGERVPTLRLSRMDSGCDSRADGVSLTAVIEIIRSICVGVGSGLVFSLQLAQSCDDGLLSEGQGITSFRPATTGHDAGRSWPRYDQRRALGHVAALGTGADRPSRWAGACTGRPSAGGPIVPFRAVIPPSTA